MYEHIWPIYLYVDGDHDLETLPETDGPLVWLLAAGCQSFETRDLAKAAVGGNKGLRETTDNIFVQTLPT